MAKIKDLKNHLQERERQQFEFDDDTIEDVVRSHVTFNDSGSEWNKVYCAVCGDGSRTKGPRGGWKFDGENCAYSCFNCPISGAFTPQNEIFMSNDMKRVFEAFGIPKREYVKILFKFRNNKNSTLKKPELKKEKRIEDLISEGIQLPDYLVDLESAKNTNIGKKAIRFLEEEKCINYKDYPFFITYGKTNSKNQQDKINAKILINRLIIPIYYKNRLLLLQGRALENNTKNKYINIGNVASTLYGLNNLKDEHKYVFITDGFFDAYHLSGVSCITKKLTTPQIDILNKIDKPKVVVPDKGESTLLTKAIEQGWGFSSPKHLQNCKDITESVKKYGKLVTVYETMKGVKLGDEAEFFAKTLGAV